MTGVQMMAARQNLLKEYPMCAKFNMSFTSYASRRAGTNLLAVINAEDVIRRAHGNWKACSAMADVYTEDRLMISAKAKTLVAGVIQLTIKRLGKTDSVGETSHLQCGKRTGTRSWTTRPCCTTTSRFPIGPESL